MKRVIFLLLSLTTVLASCKKNEIEKKPPVVQIISITGITDTSATIESQIIDDEGSAIIAKGVVWDTTQNPVITKNAKTDDGKKAGVFTSTIKGLLPVTNYSVRAYAIKNNDTVYSTAMKFTTAKSLSLPEVRTVSVTPYTTSTTAYCEGAVESVGDGSIIENGMVWGTDSNLSVDHSFKVAYTPSCFGTCGFGNVISNLQPGATYYVRAYATSEIGTAYGNAIEFAQLNPAWSNLDLYKDEAVDITMGTVHMDAESRHFSSGSVLNGFDLPDGVNMYISFDDVNGLIYYTLGGVEYTPKSKDIVYIPKDSTIYIGADSQENDHIWYWGKGTYTIHIAGRSTSTDSQYYCKYVDLGGWGITFIFNNFQSDTNYLCEYKH